MPVKVLVDPTARLGVPWVERPVAVLLGKVAASKANEEGVAPTNEWSGPVSEGAESEGAERGSGT